MNRVIENLLKVEELTKILRDAKKEVPDNPSKFAHSLMRNNEVDLNQLRSIGATEFSFFTSQGIVTCSLLDGTVLISVEGLYINHIVPYKGKLVTSSAATFIFEEAADHIGGYDIKVVISLDPNNKIHLDEFTVENNAM